MEPPLIRCRNDNFSRACIESMDCSVGDIGRAFYSRKKSIAEDNIDDIERMTR